MGEGGLEERWGLVRGREYRASVRGCGAGPDPVGPVGELGQVVDPALGQRLLAGTRCGVEPVDRGGLRDRGDL
jgi:hypothetical protein